MKPRPCTRRPTAAIHRRVRILNISPSSCLGAALIGQQFGPKRADQVTEIEQIAHLGFQHFIDDLAECSGDEEDAEQQRACRRSSIAPTPTVPVPSNDSRMIQIIAPRNVPHADVGCSMPQPSPSSPACMHEQHQSGHPRDAATAESAALPSCPARIPLARLDGQIERQCVVAQIRARPVPAPA